MIAGIILILILEDFYTIENMLFFFNYWIQLIWFSITLLEAVFVWLSQVKSNIIIQHKTSLQSLVIHLSDYILSHLKWSTSSLIHDSLLRSLLNNVFRKELK